MLVILTEEQVIPTQRVCQGCLMADRQGLPRWNHGKLGCGHALGKSSNQQPNLYECQMGFLLASIED